MEFQDRTKYHTWEVRASETTSSQVLELILSRSEAISPLELSLLTGMTVHQASNFITVPLISSVRMGWYQEHTI